MENAILHKKAIVEKYTNIIFRERIRKVSFVFFYQTGVVSAVTKGLSPNFAFNIKRI